MSRLGGVRKIVAQVLKPLMKECCRGKTPTQQIYFFLMYEVNINKTQVIFEKENEKETAKQKLSANEE